MPKIARVRLPDGRVARFRVPDNATPEQIKAAVGKKMGGEKRGVTGFLNNAVSSLNQAAIGAVEGVHNVASAITDPIAGAVFGDEAVERVNRGRRQVVDTVERTMAPVANPVARTAGRIGGAIAVPLPKAGAIAAIPKVGKAAVRAIQGAIGGAGVREVDESAAAPASIGAAANVVAPPIISRIAQTAPVQAAVRGVGNALAPVVGIADDAAEAVLPRVNKMLGRQHTPLRGMPAPTPQHPLAPLGVDAQKRAARFKSLGVDNPTTGMVTRDPKAFSFERNAAKLEGVGDDLAQQMQQVETSLVNKGRTLVKRLGGSKSSEAVGRSAQGVLNAQREAEQKLTARLYEKVRATRGDEPVGDLKTFRDFMEESDMADNAIFDTMRESINRRLARITQGGSVTVKQAEELRKFIRGLGSNSEPSVREARRQLISALDDDVVEAVGDDAFKAARASAKAGFEKWKKTFAGKLADEGIAPELLTKRILGDGVRLSDVREVKQTLTASPEGRKAWLGLQARSIDDLLDKAVTGDGMLKGATLHRLFKGNEDKFRELLTPKDYRILRDLAEATRDVKEFPVGHSVNTSNTTIAAANLFGNAPRAIKTGWLKFLGRIVARAGAHAGATAVAGPAGNLAVESARAASGAVASTRAQEAAARELLKKVQMARSPETAAAAIREAQEAAASNPIVADALKKAGIKGVALGGVAASPQ